MDLITTPELTRIVHAALREFENNPEEPTPVWDALTPTQQSYLVKLTEYLLDYPELTPSEFHSHWLEFSLEQGWVLGDLNIKNKSHPELKPWDQTSHSYRGKIYLRLELTRHLWATMNVTRAWETPELVV